jgi:hypothetical protein
MSTLHLNFANVSDRGKGCDDGTICNSISLVKQTQQQRASSSNSFNNAKAAGYVVFEWKMREEAKIRTKQQIVIYLRLPITFSQCQSTTSFFNKRLFGD